MLDQLLNESLLAQHLPSRAIGRQCPEERETVLGGRGGAAVAPAEHRHRGRRRGRILLRIVGDDEGRALELEGVLAALIAIVGDELAPAGQHALDYLAQLLERRLALAAVLLGEQLDGTVDLGAAGDGGAAARLRRGRAVVQGSVQAVLRYLHLFCGMGEGGFLIAIEDYSFFLFQG